MLKKLLTNIWTIIGAAIVVIMFLALRSCSLHDQNSVLKGKYDTLDKISKADHKLLTDDITKVQDSNKKLTKENAGLVNDIGRLTNDIGQVKKTEIATKVESDKLKTEIQPVIDANPKLKEFVSRLETRLDQKDVIIAKQETLILTLGIPKIEGFINGIPFFSFPEGSLTYNLNQMRIGEISIGEDWKKDYENEHTLRLLGEKRIGKLESSLRWSRFWRTGITTLAVVMGGYVGYTLIKGK